MKNNTLHITFKDPLVCTDRITGNLRLINCRSMRCNSIKDAERILSKRNKLNIKKSIFTDKKGIETKPK